MNSSLNVRPYNNFGVSGIYQKQTKAASHSHSSAQTLSGLVNPPPSFLSEAAIFFLQVNTLFHWKYGQGNDNGKSLRISIFDFNFKSA